jgi:ABC-2 type transport system ATP-binding protein
MDSAIQLTDVTKTFRKHTAVDTLSLTVPRGAIYGFIGPNGSGKTTTLRMILRIFYPDHGTVSVLGQHGGQAADDRVGYLPEERGLYKKMRVRELLQFHAALKGKRDSRSAIDRWLDRFEFGAWANHRIEALSKGMAQKVQFMAAVVTAPELVILDEPFSGLDPINMETLKDAVLELRDAGSTVIFSTHDMDVAERMCDTIFMIFRGRKVLDGTLESIQSQYGADTIRVKTTLPGATLNTFPGVENTNDYGQYKEMRMSSGADSQKILRAILDHGPVQHFELARPSLRDIFVRIAGPEAGGNDNV